jgi:hypothetical protein
VVIDSLMVEFQKKMVFDSLMMGLQARGGI